MRYFQLRTHLINPSVSPAEQIPIPCLSCVSVCAARGAQQVSTATREGELLAPRVTMLRCRAVLFCVSRAHREEEAGKGAVKVLLHTYPCVEGRRERNRLKNSPRPQDKAVHPCHPTCERCYTARLPFPGGAWPPQ